MIGRIWIVLLASVLTVLALAQVAAAGPRGDLGVNVNDNRLYQAPPNADSVSGTATLNGTWWWDFETEDYDLAVTNPTIEVNSAYPASDFTCLGAASFPVFGAPQATLSPGDSYFPGLCLFSTIPVSFSSGFDAMRAVSPTTVPAGGGTQQVTLTITPRATTGFYKVALQSDGLDNVTSSSGPGNLGQGEVLGGGGDGYVLFNPVIGKSYAFVFTVSVSNPFGVPFAHKSSATIIGEDGTSSCCQGPTDSVIVSDPNLNGQITYSVDQMVAAWSVNHYDGWAVGFRDLASVLPPTSADQCKNGGWQAFGTFKNQGDCVSYVATRGTNPPG